MGENGAFSTRRVQVYWKSSPETWCAGFNSGFSLILSPLAGRDTKSGRGYVLVGWRQVGYIGFYPVSSLIWDVSSQRGAFRESCLLGDRESSKVGGDRLVPVIFDQIWRFTI